MLIKQIQRAAVAAWSPDGNQLVGGSAAQQLDASFNTSAALEVFDLSLAKPLADLEVAASITSANRFHKLAWGSYNKSSEAGVIVGGCDDGVLQIYNANKLLENNGDAVYTNKHTGAVKALDFNPFQSNLLASGAAQSEIYIWDLNNTTTPMTPGTKSQPAENVQWISWNCQVQHILASTFASRCVVWDLRKNEPIIKLTDSNGRVSWRVVAWHPDVATQLCLASEHDLAPVIQLWDLRFATAPLKVLENHTRGILSIAWCQQDSDLLISCGKDNRILCWNPNSNEPGGEVLSELARTSQWSFEVSWCPRNPALISASSSDGLLSVYSLMGGPSQAQLQVSQQQTSQMLADSFPGMGDYGQNIPQQNVRSEQVNSDLAKPPKWLKKPVGASFGFGGKLITFAVEKPPATQGQSDVPVPVQRMVRISQVITEPDVVSRSLQLETAIQEQNFIDYCHKKADATSSQHRRYVWYFLKSYFEPDQRTELLNLLGYKQEDVYSKLNEHVNKIKNNVDNLTNKMAALNRGVSSESEDPILSSDTSADLSPGLDISGVFDALSGNNLDDRKPFAINTSDDNEGLITQALLTGNIEMAVELCFEADRMADALVLATSGSAELVARAQQRYLERTAGSRLAPLVSAQVREDWTSVIENCESRCWREALVAALSHTSQQQLFYLCQKLGERLQLDQETQDAVLCYICAGSVQELVTSWWTKQFTYAELQDLVEVVAILQKAVEMQGRQVEISGKLADLLSQYALLLASQGNLAPALMYLGTKCDNSIVNELRERLSCALGHKHPYGVPNKQETYQSQTTRKPSYFQPQATYNPNPYNPVSGGGVAGSIQPSWMPQNPPTMSPAIQNNSQIPPGVFMQTAARPFSPAPASGPPPPPRPSSTNSVQGSASSGIHRSKYVLDPSVQQATPAYGNYASSGVPTYNNNPMMTPPMQSNNPVPTFHGNMGGQNAMFQPMANNVLQPNPLMPTNPMLSNPMIPNPTSYSAAPHLPPNQYVSNNNQNNVAPLSYPNAPSTPNATPYPVAPPLNYAQPSAPGWNDPPLIGKSHKPSPKNEYPPPSAITHPLYASAAPEANNGFVDNQTYGFPTQAPAPPVYPGGVSNGYNQQAYAQPAQLPPGPIEVAQIAEPPKPKAPIPEEHMHLKTVLDELQTQCAAAANSPQMRRKLDDVKNKLETLYDMLRMEQLSSNTLAVLHDMVQMVQVGNYNGGLGLHTQLVSGPDFAQIASFMPGVKVLLQCSQQLQVYLR